VVNGRTYTAGNYSILSTPTDHVWILRGTKQQSGFLVTQSTESNTLVDRSKVVFSCYNNRKVCFLSEFWSSGSHIGSSCQ